MENTIPPIYNNEITAFDRKYTKRFVPKVLQSERGLIPGFLRGYFEEQATTTCPALQEISDCLPYPDNTDFEEKFQHAGTLVGLVQDAASVGFALASLGSRAVGLFHPEANSLADYLQADPVLNTIKNLFYVKLAGQVGSLIYSKRLESDKKKKNPINFDSYKIQSIDSPTSSLSKEKLKYGAQQ